MAAVTLVRSDVPSFQLAHPAVRRTSWAELTAAGLLALTALGLWTVVLPIEVLALVSRT